MKGSALRGSAWLTSVVVSLWSGMWIGAHFQTKTVATMSHGQHTTTVTAPTHVRHTSSGSTETTRNSKPVKHTTQTAHPGVKTASGVHLRLLWPLQGHVVQGYGWQYSQTYRAWRYHEALNIQGTEGKPVHASFGGVVSKIAHGEPYGLRVTIQDGPLIATYSDLHQVSVHQGQWVNPNAQIGSVGKSAWSATHEGPHLRFSVRYQNKSLNPTPFMVATTTPAS